MKVYPPTLEAYSGHGEAATGCAPQSLASRTGPITTLKIVTPSFGSLFRALEGCNGVRAPISCQAKGANDPHESLTT